MSVYIDRKYLMMISNRLLNFKQKTQDLYNFSCPICGDSNKKKGKARGYIYRKNNDLFYKCFNDESCGTTFYKFLNNIDPSLAKEYSLERFKEGEDKNHNYTKPKLPKFSKPIFKKKEFFPIPSIKDLDDDHLAKKYVLQRKIPKGHFKDLFYAEDFKKFVMEVKPDYEKTLVENDPRIIIPFKDKDGNIFAFQGRALGDSKIRYITVKLDEDAKKIFGLERLNKNTKIYVTEGPIDSLFLENAIATADANLGAAEFLGKGNLVLVFDNEPRNLQIVKQVKKSIDDGFNVCLFPESFKGKDINEAVLNGMTKPEIRRMIDYHTYNGLRAQVEFNKWKKC